LDIEKTTLREKGENCIPEDSEFVLFTKDVQIEEDEMGGTYRLHGDLRNAYTISTRKPEGKETISQSFE
jgi:hypothetical protein